MRLYDFLYYRFSSVDATGSIIASITVSQDLSLTEPSRNKETVMASFLPLQYADSYLTLEDHGLIGDGTTAALVGRDGVIAWLCLPRFDSTPVFCRPARCHPGRRLRSHPQICWRLDNSMNQRTRCWSRKCAAARVWFRSRTHSPYGPVLISSKIHEPSSRTEVKPHRRLLMCADNSANAEYSAGAAALSANRSNAIAGLLAPSVYRPRHPSGDDIGD